MVVEGNPKVEGLILPRHGIFTFAEDAKTAYEKMIEFVTLAVSVRIAIRERSRRKGCGACCSPIMPTANL
jgi:rhamnose utilization protein RhaD (predicted bifunctional aldolase and dehydrogenase)